MDIFYEEIFAFLSIEVNCAETPRTGISGTGNCYAMRAFPTLFVGELDV